MRIALGFGGGSTTQQSMPRHSFESGCIREDPNLLSADRGNDADLRGYGS
jgi:hypothetical protein